MELEQISYISNLVSLAGMGLLWCVFAVIIYLGRVSDKSRYRSREPRSWVGLALQLAGILLTWTIWRSPVASPLIAEQFILNIVLQYLALLIAATSTWLAMAAIRELGKQWSLQARVLEDHKLITTGVYGLVRHPIYTAMLGMLLATGIVFSHWGALAGGLVLFLIGTNIRTSLEEKLLRDAFGMEYETWSDEVPALIPRSLKIHH
jgi:protein-S-isoprenylcysteine O-methyltransferase Ste14